MHVLHIISNLHMGGAETALVRLVRHLGPAADDGTPWRHTVISMIPGGPNAPRLAEAGADVIELGGRRSAGALGTLPQILSIARRAAPDIVQGWMYHANLAAAAVPLLARQRCPVVWGVRQTVARLADNRPLTQACILGATALRTVPRWIVYNSEIAAAQHERLGYPRAKRQVILNGIDTEQFRPRDDARARLRDALGLPPRVRLIGRVARYAAMKDNPTLLAAFDRIAAADADVHLVLIGLGMDAANAELARLIDPVRLGTRVHLMGQRLDVDELVPGLDIAVSSSGDSEGFSNALAEAMACAVPVVATDVGEAAHMIADAARIVPPRQPAAFAAAVLRLLTMPDAERTALGRRDRDRVIEAFGIGRFSRAFATLWRASLDERQR